MYRDRFGADACELRGKKLFLPDMDGTIYQEDRLFEGTLEKVVALAVLMPIVASMGGIAGTQTLTLVIRGMALGHVGSANARWLLTREVAVGFLNGLMWAVVVGAVSVAGLLITTEAMVADRPAADHAPAMPGGGMGGGMGDMDY